MTKASLLISPAKAIIGQVGFEGFEHGRRGEAKVAPVAVFKLVELCEKKGKRCQAQNENPTPIPRKTHLEPPYKRHPQQINVGSIIELVPPSPLDINLRSPSLARMINRARLRHMKLFTISIREPRKVVAVGVVNPLPQIPPHQRVHELVWRRNIVGVLVGIIYVVKRHADDVDGGGVFEREVRAVGVVGWSPAVEDVGRPDVDSAGCSDGSGDSDVDR